MLDVFHFCGSSVCRLNFYLVPLKRNYSIVSYIFRVKWTFKVVWTNTVSPGCNLVGNGLSLGSLLSRANLRFVAAISNIFFIASKERTLTSFPKYLILVINNISPKQIFSSMKRLSGNWESNPGPSVTSRVPYLYFRF